MTLNYEAGDDLVFQMESGFGLMRVLGSDGVGPDAVWHVLVYQEFYPDVESAEAALAAGVPLAVREPHLTLTTHAFEKTPAARLMNRPVAGEELEPLERWRRAGGAVEDRSLLLLLGMR
jgi:hypothetical protein